MSDIMSEAIIVNLKTDNTQVLYLLPVALTSGVGKSLAFKPRHWQRVSSCQWKNREPQFVQKLDNTAVPATKLMGACVIHGCNSIGEGTILVVRVDVASTTEGTVVPVFVASCGRLVVGR